MMKELQPMGYAVLQKELIAPDLEALKRGCRVLPTLRDIDAQNMFQDAYGILIKGLDALDANALQEGLQAEGVATQVVEESELPIIPPAKVIRQIEFLPPHLNMYDPMGRVFALPWQDIMMLAAGNVKVPEFKRGKPAHEEQQFHGMSHDTLTDTRIREEHRPQLMLEIFLVGGISRYSVTGETFEFGYLGERLTADLQTNFALLLKDLAEFAPHAGMNRGAYMATQEQGEVLKYPSKHAFYEELVWMLWRISESKSVA
ncbi:MAG TPA: hypothetical protein VMZ27_13170 [Candidatus Saccharimonadales bacterium]|nr:hypothetical protein [Candidatus Saccharimonadales bacterium]